MPKVFCAIRGGRLTIDNLGIVTDKIGLEISDTLATELAKDRRLLRIEQDPPPVPTLGDGRKSADPPKPPPKQSKKPERSS